MRLIIRDCVLRAQAVKYKSLANPTCVYSFNTISCEIAGADTSVLSTDF